MTHQKIKKRLFNLWTGEFAALLAFILFYYTFKQNLHMEMGLVIVYPFSLLIFVLLQGSYYWLHCLLRLNKWVRNPNSFKVLYRVLKILDLVIIALFPFIMLYSWLGGPQLTWKKTLIAVFIFLFGLAEYINYFFIRLSYSNWKDIVSLIKFRNLKRSALNKELSR